MRLYIAEKPSMGREIAKCLPGPMQKGDGWIETAGGIVTWGYGHILRQAEPQEYDARYAKWRAEDLPIVPNAWKLVVSESAAKQFEIVRNLIARADEIVHAGDPDREGQLLIDEVLDYVGNTKPVKRILLNALDEKSIKEANADLRDNRDFAALKASALARSRADWLIGMNLSRAYTLAARRAGHDVTLPIGRVKTPTLALVVRREREIQDFHPVDYYTIKARFVHANGSFQATWKPASTAHGLDADGRLVDRAVAEAQLEALQAAATTDGVISSYTKTKKEEPPRLPFSLSALQVLAGKRFGYDPQQVLDTAQELYEKKLTTYPRSDCEYLPKNQFGAAQTICKNLMAAGDEQLAAWAMSADTKRKSRAWNDAKITAHHAIIPTTVRVSLASLTKMQCDIYLLIAQAYLAQFYPAYVYDQTKVGVRYAGATFAASGRTVRDMGWKALYAGTKAEKQEADEGVDGADDEATTELPAMAKNDPVRYEAGKMDTKKTRPPVRFTPSTLLAAMKEIHKYVKDEEAKKQLKDVHGIGTEATRATIIEDLVRRKFLHAEGKKKTLTPQPSAYLLIDALPDEMTYPDKTAVWEDALHSMAAGQASLDAFLVEQEKFARALCEAALHITLKSADGVKCPQCGRGVLTKRNGKHGAFWGCSHFPRCRMTCEDQDGKPNLTGAKGRYPRADGAVQVTGRASNGKPGTASSKHRAPSSPRPPQARSGGASSYGYGGIAPMSEAEMAAFTASYEPTLSAHAYGYGGSPSAASPRQTSPRTWSRATKPAAAALEKTAKDAPTSTVLCPRCREGHLRLIHGRNGDFWGCSNYPHCTATYDDQKGMPLLNN